MIMKGCGGDLRVAAGRDLAPDPWGAADCFQEKARGSCFHERSSFLLLKETSFQSTAFYQLLTEVGWYPPKKVPRRLKPVA